MNTPSLKALKSLLAALACLCCSVRAEDALLFEAEAIASPVLVYKDKSAAGGKCIATDVSKEDGTFLDVELPEELRPGLYRAGLLMRISSRSEPLAKGLQAAVSIADGTRRLTYLNLDDVVYQRFDVLFQLQKRTAPSLKITWKHDAEVHKEALGVTVAGQDVSQLAPKLLEGEEKDLGEGEEELAILQGGKPLSEAGRIWIAVDQLIIEPVTHVARVKSVWPEKIHYEPGSDTWADVTVVSFSDTDLACELALEMLCDLDQGAEIGRKPVKIEPRGKTVTRFDFNVGKAEFGRELRATVYVDGKPVNSASEFFGVSEQVWKVGICGQGWSAGGSYGWAKRVDWLVEANRANYGNFYEEFAWAPSDYCDMTPDTEEFWSGQTQYHGTITDCKAVIDGLHKHGIKAITYGKSCGGGLPGFETLRKHPDWYWSYPAGMGIEGGPEVDFLDRMRALDFSLAAKDGWQSWQGQWADSRVEAVVRFGAEEIVRSTDLLKWDGIRWDGHFMTDSDEITAKNSKLVKEIVWKKYPRFLHGYNYLNPQYSDKEIAVYEYPSVPQLLDFEECARDGGLIMNEGLRDFSNRNFSHRTMWVFMEAMALEGDWVHNLGGYYLAIGFDRATNLDALYNHIFFLAAGARPYGQGGQSSVGHFWRFATRYSCLVYNNTRRRLANPEQFIAVESPWPVWWNKHVFFRTLDGNRRQIMVNIIGKPENERFNELKQPPPPLQKDVKLKFKLPQGWSAAKAYQVSIELDGYQRELKPEQAGGETVLTLPEMRYWSIAVLELEEKPGAVALKFTDPVGDARRGLAKKQAEQAEAERKAAEDAKIRPPEPQKPAEPVTDQQRLAKSNVAKLDEPVLLRNGVTDILLAKGVYHWMYEIEEAIGWAGGAGVSDAKMNMKGGWFQGAEQSMPDMPKTFDDIRHLDVIVMNNVPAAYMTLEQRYLIERFVQAGGGLFVIGGEWSLDRGAFQDTFLDALLPVTMPPASPLQTTIYKDGLPLKPTERLQLKDPVNWGASPHIFCLHNLTPKPDTQVLLTAGDKPLVVEGSYGKGKVIIFAGSTMGIVPDGKLPFWHWDGLPVVFAELLARLTAGSEQVTREKPPEVDRDKAMESVINLADMDAKEQMEVIRTLCAVCDEEAARGLIGILGTATQFPSEAYPLVAKSVRPFVDKSFDSEAMDAAKSEIREAQAVGTSLLGLAVGEQARDMLVERLNDMDTGVQRAAAVGLGDLRSAKSIEPLLKRLQDLRGKAVADDEGMSDLAGLEHDLIVALYRSGHKPALAELIGANERAAAQIVRFERRKEALLEQAGTAFKLTPREWRAWQAQIHRSVDRKIWWRDECRRLSQELRGIPPDWLDSVFEKAAVVNEPASVSLVCTVLKDLRKPEMASQFVPLVSAKNPVIRMLALKPVLSFGSAEDKAKAAERILKMSSGGHHFQRLYALRRLRLFPEDQRAAILAELLKDIQPEVRLTARAMLYLVSDVAKRTELAKIRSVYDANVVLD
jgi:uncharacterized membrane protein